MNFFGHKTGHRVCFALFSIFCIGFLLLFRGTACPAPAGQENGKKEENRISNRLTGSDIMDQVFRRRLLFPYVYEEQTLVLTDHMGNKDVKKMRRFSRLETNGNFQYLLVFDSPAEVRGLALMITRNPRGIVHSRIYLPALGEFVSSDLKKNRSHDFMGTDFSIEDLVETGSDVIYTRMPDQLLPKQNTLAYFVVEASPKDSSPAKGASICRHYIRQDNLMVVRTDFFDPGKRLQKRLTRHDLRKTDKDRWQGNMLLMENIRDQHITLIKTDRRVLSRDYVPAEVFTTAWLQETYPFQEIPETDAENTPASSAERPADKDH